MLDRPDTTGRRRAAAHSTSRRPTRGALVVIDEAPLKRAAWAELHAARKRQEKAARDLHRHEQTDRPAYDAWLNHTFPTLITLLRELHQEVFAKGQKVETVMAISAMTGRLPRKIWREQKAEELNPKTAESEQEAAADGTGRKAERDGMPDDDDDDFFEGGRGFGRESRPDWDDPFQPGRKARSGRGPIPEARDVYRRLVQRLHPDRGGEWTVARQRLWHEVQLAWAAGDADWLMRLEVEWEAAHDVLNPASPLSRLRRASEELHAARRDTERKLRQYRESPPWRFTLTAKKRELLRRRTEMNFQHDIAFLQRQLAHLNATIESWEKSPQPRRRYRARYAEFQFDE